MTTTRNRHIAVLIAALLAVARSSLAVSNNPVPPPVRGGDASRVGELRESGMGWGEIKAAFALADGASVSLSDIFAMRESGMGWGEIAQARGIALNEIIGAQRLPRADTLRDSVGGGMDAPEAPELSAARRADRIEAIRAMYELDYGWGEIDHALAIRKKNGLPLEEITALRENGAPWSEIAQESKTSLVELRRTKRP